MLKSHISHIILQVTLITVLLADSGCQAPPESLADRDGGSAHLPQMSYITLLGPTSETAPRECDVFGVFLTTEDGRERVVKIVATDCLSTTGGDRVCQPFVAGDEVVVYGWVHDQWCDRPLHHWDADVTTLTSEP